MSPRWPPSEIVRFAWAARRDTVARTHLLQAFQAGADFNAPLSSTELGSDPFAVPRVCVAGVVVRELTGVKDAEEWLHALLRAHELHQVLPPTARSAGKQRF